MQHFEAVRQVMAAVMMVDPSEIAEDTQPNSLSAWDSLRHLNLMLALEEEFGFTLAPEEIEAMVSVKKICDIVAAKTA
jgi:acyl carrier protein